MASQRAGRFVHLMAVRAREVLFVRESGFDIELFIHHLVESGESLFYHGLVETMNSVFQRKFYFQLVQFDGGWGFGLDQVDREHFGFRRGEGDRVEHGGEGFELLVEVIGFREHKLNPACNQLIGTGVSQLQRGNQLVQNLSKSWFQKEEDRQLALASNCQLILSKSYSIIPQITYSINCFTSLSKMSSKQYQYLKVLGQGSFGTVHLVKANGTQELLVDKIIPLYDVSEPQIRRIVGEAQILKTLNHPNIIKFKDYHIEQNNLHILMEYAHNGDLASVIQNCQNKRKVIPEEQILDWAIQLLEGIDYIHRNRVMHRDLKGQNVFVGEGGVLKIGDFGVSTVLGTMCEKAKTVIGTIYNISPEILNNELYTQKADIWSIGTILYQLCMLKRPFEGNSMAALILKITSGEYAPITRNLSKGLRQMVQRMLQRDPENRPWASELLQTKEVVSRKIELERLRLKQEQARLEELRRVRLNEKVKVKQIQEPQVQAKHQELPSQQTKVLNDDHRLRKKSQTSQQAPNLAEPKESQLINIDSKYSDIVTRLKQSKLLHLRQQNPTLKHLPTPPTSRIPPSQNYISLPISLSNQVTMKYNIPLHLSMSSFNLPEAPEQNPLMDGSILQRYRMRLESKLGVERLKRYYKIIEDRKYMYESVLGLTKEQRDIFEGNYKDVEELINMERRYQS